MEPNVTAAGREATEPDVPAIGASADRPVAVVSNFSPVPRRGNRIGLPAAGCWRETFNSDPIIYRGSGQGNLGRVTARSSASHGLPAPAKVAASPLMTVMFQIRRGIDR